MSSAAGARHHNSLFGEQNRINEKGREKGRKEDLGEARSTVEEAVMFYRSTLAHMKPSSLKVSFIGKRVEIQTAILSFSLVVSRFGSPKVRRDAEIERLVFVPYFTSQLDRKKQRNKL
jgi:hypothetical protein